MSFNSARGIIEIPVLLAIVALIVTSAALFATTGPAPSLPSPTGEAICEPGPDHTFKIRIFWSNQGSDWMYRVNWEGHTGTPDSIYDSTRNSSDYFSGITGTAGATRNLVIYVRTADPSDPNDQTKMGPASSGILPIPDWNTTTCATPSGTGSASISVGAVSTSVPGGGYTARVTSTITNGGSAASGAFNVTWTVDNGTSGCDSSAPLSCTFTRPGLAVGGSELSYLDFNTTSSTYTACISVGSSQQCKTVTTGGSSVSCTTYQPTANIGELVYFYPTGGDGYNYSWSTPSSAGASQTSGTGTSFASSWSTSGSKTVNVTSAGQSGSCSTTINGATNNPPTTPTTPTGSTSVSAGSTQTYSTTSSDPNGNLSKIDFQILTPGATSWTTQSQNSSSGCQTTCTISTNYTFSQSGQYLIRAIAYDALGSSSGLSSWITIASGIAAPTGLTVNEITSSPPCAVKFSWTSASQNNWGIDISLQSNFSSYSRPANAFTSIPSGITEFTASSLTGYYGTGAPTSLVPGNTYYWRIYYGVSGGFVSGSSFAISQCQIPNAKPTVPSGLTSPANNNATGLYDISASASDSDNDKIYIKFAVRDTTGATNYIDSALTTTGCASSCTRSVQGSFWVVGTYTVNAIAYDEHGAISANWSPNYTITIPPPATDNAAFHSQSGVPTTMTVGQTANVWVSMRNTGNNTWTAGTGTGSYRLGTQNPQDNNTWGINRANLTGNVPPEGIPTFNFNITAPNTPGTYNFQWQMLKEGVGWFGDKSTNVAITVGSAPKPVITLTTSQPSINAGELSALTWSVTNNPTSCSATPSGWFDNTKLTSGSATLSPTSTTTYTLTCTNDGGTSDQKSVTITVSTVQKPVVTLSTNQPSINAGELSALTWSVTNSPTSCTATPSGWFDDTKLSSGSATISPTSTTTYTLSCSNSAGSNSDSETISVGSTLSVTLDPPNKNYSGSDQAGATSTNGCLVNGATPGLAAVSFSWTASGGTSPYNYLLSWAGDISSDTGIITGNNVVISGWNPAKLYTATIKVTDAAGNTKTSTPQTFTTNNCVTPQAPVVTLNASSTSVTSGASVTLSWSVTNSPTSCSATPSGWFNSSSLTSGSSTVSPTSTTTYTLSCSNSVGSNSDSKTVNVGSALNVTLDPPNKNYSGSDQAGATSTNGCLVNGATPGLAAVSFSWTASGGTSPYNYLLSWAGDISSDTGIITGNNVVISGWNPNKQYSATITARDAAGNSKTSTPKTFTTNNCVTSQAPVVTLNASSTSVTSGASVTLSWSATNSPTSCTASGAWSGSKNASGSQSVTVSQNSTYTLTCSNSGGTSDPASATVTINTPTTLTPTISTNSNYTGLNYPYDNVQVNNGCVNQGGVYSAGIEFKFDSNAPASANPQYRLEWVFQGNNYSYPEDPGAYVTLAENPQKRAVNVGWTAGTHYVTLKARATGYNDATMSPTSFQAKDCQPLPSKPVVSISANPTSVTTGGTSTLNWSATNSPTSCTASGAWSGSKNASGSQSVTVSQNSTYTLTCSNSGGTSDPASATVSVSPALNVTLDPPNKNYSGSDQAGATSTNGCLVNGATPGLAAVSFSWTASGGTSPYNYLLSWAGDISSDTGIITGNNVVISGWNPAKLYTATIKVTDAAGNTKTSTPQTFTTNNCVTPQAPVVTLNASSTSVTSGASVTLSWSVTNSPTSCSATPSGWFNSSSLTSGSSTVSPTSTTTYTLSCSNSVGSNSNSKTVSLGTSGDSVAPVVTITSHSTGQTLSGVVIITATATDNVAVTETALTIDQNTDFNNYVSATGTSPNNVYNNSIDTSNYSEGSHVLYVTAFDAAHNQKSASINVTFSNPYTLTAGTSYCPNLSFSWNRPAGSNTHIKIYDSAGNNLAEQLVTGLQSYIWTSAEANTTYTAKLFHWDTLVSGNIPATCTNLPPAGSDTIPIRDTSVRATNPGRATSNGNALAWWDANGGTANLTSAYNWLESAAVSHGWNPVFLASIWGAEQGFNGVGIGYGFCDGCTANSRPDCIVAGDPLWGTPGLEQLELQWNCFFASSYSEFANNQYDDFGMRWNGGYWMQYERYSIKSIYDEFRPSK